jgi:hypothetical protein
MYDQQNWAWDREWREETKNSTKIIVNRENIARGEATTGKAAV